MQGMSERQYAAHVGRVGALAVFLGVGLAAANGPGIATDAQEAIFHEFVQLDNPERNRAKGLGLGLAIVRRLTTLLGHPLRLRSAPGRGALFAVTLPVTVPRPQDHNPPAAAAHSLAGLHVALIDDDPLAAALTTGGRGFLALSPATETPSYQVVVNPNQEYELWDPQERPLAGMQPPLRIDEPHAAETVVTRLLRLARFHLIAEICASPSELAAQVQVELLRDAPDQPAPVFCAPVGDAYEFPSGTTALLRIRNGSARAINVACLDLQCDWGISMVVPSKETTSAPYETLGPSESKSFVLQFYLPPGYESTLDVLKVIITVGHADCRWFEQDAIGAPPRSAERGGQERGPANHALERLIAMTEVKENSTRHVISASAPGAEWTVRQLRVLVRNPAQ